MLVPVLHQGFASQLATPKKQMLVGVLILYGYDSLIG